MDKTDKTINEKVAEIKRDYYKQYRDANKDKLNQYQRDYRAKNKDKVKEYNKNYWLKKANNQELSSTI